MKSGFVTLIGRTNAGKSSLINYLVGEKISLVSHKINATRRKINAITMHGEDQVIFIDTPGIHESNKIINKLMVEVAIKSIGDADLILFLASIHDDLEDYEKFLSLNSKAKHIVVLTKCDEANDKKIVSKLQNYQKFQDKFEVLIPISVKKNIYRGIILDEIVKFLPVHDYYYDPEILSSTNLRDIYRDFILEAIFESVSSEIPYFSDVLIDKITEKPNLLDIKAKIITDTNSHKIILIGKKGETVKRIGIKSRKKILDFSKIKTNVILEIIVKKDWTKKEKSLKSEFIY